MESDTEERASSTDIPKVSVSEGYMKMFASERSCSFFCSNTQNAARKMFGQNCIYESFPSIQNIFREN